MINKQFIKKLKQEYKKREGERRQIIAQANIILHDSKRVIFSLHRGEKNIAKTSLERIEKSLKELEKKFSYARAIEEGVYRAAVEEYVEAKLFFLVLTEGKIEKISNIKLDVESYLGGISDLTGELGRYAINSAAEGNFEEVEKIKKIINNIMAELVEFDMTGYLRTKYDQAKNNLRKIEQIAYEIRLKIK